jgi:hypothetical protein
MTCAAGNYAAMDAVGHLARSVADVALWTNGGGIVAAVAPTGLSVNDEATLINQALVEAMYGATPVGSLGEALLEGLRAQATSGSYRFMREIYGVLGDPALDVH